MGCECIKLSFDTENEIKKENYNEKTPFSSNLNEEYDNPNENTNYKSIRPRNYNMENENNHNIRPKYDDENKYGKEEVNNIEKQIIDGIEKIEEVNENNINDKNSFNNNNKSNFSDKDNIQDHSEYLVKKINVNTPKREEKIKNINKDLLPNDDFSKYIFEEINKLRKDPKSFISLIEESKSKVTTKNDKLIYKSKVKVALYKGIPAFDEAIKYLEETDSMDELIFNPEICVELPESEEEIKNKTYLKSKIQEMEDKGIYVKTYWKDNIKEPEACFVLMIVDDTMNKSGNKRRDLLNPDMKYIGISSIKIEKTFVCYITLSDK